MLGLLVLGLTGPSSIAQVVAPVDSTQIDAKLERQRVVLTDGNVMVGVVLDERDDAVVLRSEDGLETTIPRSRIREVGPLLERGLSQYDPTRTRLFFSPTARTLPRGAGRISGYYLIPSVAYGFTDRLDVSYGTLIPLVVNALNVKYQVVRRERVQVALGVGTLFTLGGSINGSASDFINSLGTLYGLVTIGSEANALTLGLYSGFATNLEDTEFAPGVVILVGYERQFTDWFKLLAENYVGVTEVNAALASLVGARFGSRRFTVDVALGLGASEGSGFQYSFTPYVGVAYNFGR
ncbi:MAG: hypothetical protein AAF624_06805 [Bacteroidota bacterium]